MTDLNPNPPAVSVSAAARLTGWIVEIFPRLVGVLFLFTAIQKIRQPMPLQAVFEFDGIPHPLVPIAAWAIISVELLLGGMLVAFMGFRRGLLLATAGLLVIYIAQLGYLLLQEQAPGCGCLGTESAPGEARWMNLLSLVRNLCLLWPLIWVWRQLSPAREKL